MRRYKPQMIMSYYTTNEMISSDHKKRRDRAIRKVGLTMNEQKKYDVIKSLADHPDTANKDRAALVLGCTKHHINRMIRGYKEYGKSYFVHGNRGRKPATAISDTQKAKIVQLYRIRSFLL